MQIQLNTLLSYQNPKIISRYKSDYPHTNLQAEEAWQELMKYIWLCHQYQFDKKHHPDDNRLHFSCVMHAEMKDIDNMWHTFILFTKDYHAFCHQYLNGIYFHHDPLFDIQNNFSEESYRLELNRYLSYIADHLGEDTLKKWFNNYF